MAGDLIPPPSPAGRPSPDPDPGFEPIPEPEPEPAAPPTLPPSRYRGRFGFLMGTLAGCGLAAAAVLVVLLTTGETERAATDEGLAPNWSEWRPHTTNALAGATEIAEHIQGTYHNEKNERLASVNGGPIAYQQYLLQVAMPSGDSLQPIPGAGIQYTLGGAGKGGILRDSKPSKARRRLLRREALELALYSFRYLPDVTMVVTLLPPAPPVEQVRPKKAAKKKPPPYQPQAIFYRAGDLREQVKVPLRETIAPTPPPIDQFDGEEARRVDKLTLSNLFEFNVGRTQDGRLYLVLERPGS